MSYRIQYSGGPGRSKKKKCFRWVIILLSAALLLCAALPPGRGVLETLLFGDTEEPAAAVERMIEQVRQGDRLEEAVEAFCSEVFHSDE